MKDPCLCARVSAAEIELPSWSCVRQHGKSSCRLDESEGLDECAWRMTLNDGQMADLRKTGSCDAIDFERSDLLLRGGLRSPSLPFALFPASAKYHKWHLEFGRYTGNRCLCCFLSISRAVVFFLSLAHSPCFLLLFFSSPPFSTAGKTKSVHIYLSSDSRVEANRQKHDRQELKDMLPNKCVLNILALVSIPA